jgi:hypothetical protein
MTIADLEVESKMIADRTGSCRFTTALAYEIEVLSSAFPSIFRF